MAREHAREAPLILSGALLEDLRRFGTILAVAAYDWEVVIARIEAHDEDGQRLAEHRRENDNRVYEFAGACDN